MAATFALPDPKYLIHALETAARARSMLTAKDTGVRHAKPRRIFSSSSNPRAKTLAEIANALGYRLTFVKQSAREPVHASASV